MSSTTSRCFIISVGLNSVGAVKGNNVNYVLPAVESGLRRVSAVNTNEFYAVDYTAKKVIKYKGMVRDFEITGLSGPRSCDFKEGALWVADGAYVRRIDGDVVGLSVSVGMAAYDVSAVSKNDVWVANANSKSFQRIVNGTVTTTISASTYYPFSVSALPNGDFWGIAHLPEEATYSYRVYYSNGATLTTQTAISGTTAPLSNYGKNVFSISSNQCVFALGKTLYKMTGSTRTTEFTDIGDIQGIDGILGNSNTFWISGGTKAKLIVSGAEKYATEVGAAYAPATIIDKPQVCFYGGI